MKMSKKWLVLLLILPLALAACSSSNQSSSAGSANRVSKSSSSDMASSPKSDSSPSQHTSSSQNTQPSQKGTGLTVIPKSKRMVIYNANMDVTVQNFNKTRSQIQTLVLQSGGYIVNSSFSKTDTGKQTGNITVRIPEQAFHSFMNQVDQIAEDVKQSHVQGQDVTKQYVDLNARLNAKMEVKDRLDSYLKKAKDTSDLLKISNQLADVQQQIEQLKGQIHYLQNHSALATISISMTETSKGIPNQGDLNTWGKIHQSFVASLNLLINIVSELVIFFVGYSPILIILLIIAFLIFWYYRRRKMREKA